MTNVASRPAPLWFALLAVLACGRAGGGDAGADAATVDAATVDAAAVDARGDSTSQPDGPNAACNPQAVAFPTGGSLTPGTLCDEIYACADDAAGAARIEAASPAFACAEGAEPASTCGAFTCSYRNPGGPSTLDEDEIEQICRVTVVSPSPRMRCVVFVQVE